MLKQAHNALFAALAVGVLFGAHAVRAEAIVDKPAFREFVDEMVAEHHFNGELLTDLFREVEVRDDVLEAIRRPAEAKPWYLYEPIFIKPGRIRDGVAFWAEHADVLDRAEAEYGVPPEIIVAILGVETRYGRYKGGYPVMDSLATLAFAYPPRAKFFRSELESYLLMTREEQIDPLSLEGSYAGAMGQPQFISSTYRHYAVDFDGDGHRDLWNNPEDAIGSVANYFKRHGWRRGDPITAPVTVTGDDYKALLERGIKPQVPLAEFPRYDVSVPKGVDAEREAALIQLETRDGHEYWAGMKNFYVITRYNHSELYAMAVYRLSREILEAREQQRTAGDAGGDQG